MRKQYVVLLIAAALLLALAGTAAAQETVIVPDLTGFNPPQAAAALNWLGLALGAETNQAWTAESGLPQNIISGQSIAAGQSVPRGSAVDVTVLRSPNVRLIYDDNDFTILNLTGGSLNLTALAFASAEGTPASFGAGSWASSLPANECVQLWSVQRGAPKDVEGCAAIQNWISTRNTAVHFWTGANGVSRFNVTQDGAERGSCPAAPAGSGALVCEVYIPANAAEDFTPYLYFAYTPDRFIIYNQSDDQWMPIGSTLLLNNNLSISQPGAPVPVGDPTLYSFRNPVADISRLAPGQCILFTNSLNIASPNPPQTCEIVARLDIDPNLIFWSAAFDFDSVTDGRRRSCAAAAPDRIIVCIMPR
jgi:hypothetical protein